MKGTAVRNDSIPSPPTMLHCSSEKQHCLSLAFPKRSIIFEGGAASRGPPGGALLTTVTKRSTLCLHRGLPNHHTVGLWGVSQTQSSCFLQAMRSHTACVGASVGVKATQGCIQIPGLDSAGCRHIHTRLPSYARLPPMSSSHQGLCLSFHLSLGRRFGVDLPHRVRRPRVSRSAFGYGKRRG